MTSSLINLSQVFRTSFWNRKTTLKCKWYFSVSYTPTEKNASNLLALCDPMPFSTILWQSNPRKEIFSQRTIRSCTSTSWTQFSWTSKRIGQTPSLHSIILSMRNSCFIKWEMCTWPSLNWIWPRKCPLLHNLQPVAAPLSNNSTPYTSTSSLLRSI